MLQLADVSCRGFDKLNQREKIRCLSLSKAITD